MNCDESRSGLSWMHGCVPDIVQCPCSHQCEMLVSPNITIVYIVEYKEVNEDDS